MSSIAITMMLITVGLVTLITAYFLWRVLTAPPRPEPDSYEENDDQPR